MQTNEILELWSVIYSIWYAYFFKHRRSKLNPVWQIKFFVSEVIFLIFKSFLIVAASRTYSDLK